MVEWQVVSARIVDFFAMKALFERGKACPRMVCGGIVGGDTPEVVVFEAVFAGVHHRLDCNDAVSV